MTRKQELGGKKLSRGTHINSVRKAPQPDIWAGLKDGVQEWWGQKIKWKTGERFGTSQGKKNTAAFSTRWWRFTTDVDNIIKIHKHLKHLHRFRYFH